MLPVIAVRTPVMAERNGRCMIAQNRGVKTELLVLKSGEGKERIGNGGSGKERSREKEM